MPAPGETDVQPRSQNSKPSASGAVTSQRKRTLKRMRREGWTIAGLSLAFGYLREDDVRDLLGESTTTSGPAAQAPTAPGASAPDGLAQRGPAS